MRKREHHRWSFQDGLAAVPTPPPIAHYPAVRTREGRWQAWCACGYTGELRVDWPDANTDGAVHGFNMRGQR
jgi:hypothetical protein